MANLLFFVPDERRKIQKIVPPPNKKFLTLPQRLKLIWKKRWIYMYIYICCNEWCVWCWRKKTSTGNIMSFQLTNLFRKYTCAGWSISPYNFENRKKFQCCRGLWIILNIRPLKRLFFVHKFTGTWVTITRVINWSARFSAIMIKSRLSCDYHVNNKFHVLNIEMVKSWMTGC